MKLKELAKLPMQLIDNNSNRLVIWKRVTIQQQQFYQVLINNTKYLQLISELELVELLQTYTRRDNDNSQIIN